MNLRTPFAMMRWLLITGLLFLGASQLGAQTKTVTSTTPASQVKKFHPPAPSSKWIKDPNSVMPMRQMTNAQRRAAAERTRTRRAKAEAQRRFNNKSQSGVQR